MYRSQNRYLYVIFILLVIGTIYLLSPVLTPFLIGALLAYLANPLVNRLMKFKISRMLAVLIVFVLLFSILILTFILLVPFIEKQFILFIGQIPNTIAMLQASVLPWVTNIFDISPDSINTDMLKRIIAENSSQAESITNWLFKYLIHSSGRLLEWIMNLLLIPVVTFYLLCDWPKILNKLRQLLPRKSEPVIIKLISECDEVLSAFLRGQLLVMLALSIIYAAGLTIVGLKTGLLIGLIAGFLSIVPYLGFIVGIISASIAAMLQIGSMTSVLLVMAVFIIGQTLDHLMLTPKLVGDRIGLHPVAVIFAVLAGGSLFGFVGVLLGLPVAALIMVWLRYAHQQYYQSKLYLN